MPRISQHSQGRLPDGFLPGCAELPRIFGRDLIDDSLEKEFGGFHHALAHRRLDAIGHGFMKVGIDVNAADIGRNVLAKARS